jgi:hypothetical protein
LKSDKRSQGRQQTTQGIWMGVAKTKGEEEKNILVFDVEGVDGRERAEHDVPAA